MGSVDFKPFAGKNNFRSQTRGFYRGYKDVQRLAANTDIQKTQRLDDSFLESFAPVGTFVQFLGLMPVCGVSKGDHKYLEFKWKSLRTVLTLMYITYGVAISITFFTFINAEGISATNIGNDYQWDCRLKHVISFLYYSGFCVFLVHGDMHDCVLLYRD